MFGFQNYPTRYEDVNFRKMHRIMQLLPNYEFGYADHTAWNDPNNVLITLLGAALGMSHIEKHVTLECGFERVDSSAAVSFGQLQHISDGLRLLELCNGNGLLEMNAGELSYCDYGPMKKAPLLKRNVNHGEIIGAADVEFKRTAARTDLSQLEAIRQFGKKASRAMQAGTILRAADFEG
jgi:N,N'-diacetyllegionaminate synthase